MAYDQLMQTYLGVGLLAARPSAPNVKAGVGAFYYATDTPALYVWDGATWHTLAGGASTLAADTDVAIASPADTQVLTYVAADGKWENKPAAAGGSGGLYSAYLCYQDQKALGTQGGTFTSPGWQTRTLNVEVADTGSHGSLAANQITLDAGTYRVHAVAPAYEVGLNQLRLQNVTDGVTLVLGSSCYDGGGTDAVSLAPLDGRFTLAASKVLELQHICQATKTTNGCGVACSFGTEVYASAEFWKE